MLQRPLHALAIATIAISFNPFLAAQESAAASPTTASAREQDLTQKVDVLERRIAALEAALNHNQGPPHGSSSDGDPAAMHSLSQDRLAGVPTANLLTEGARPQEPPPTNPANPANPAKPDPFSFADFTWLNGNSRIKEVPFQTKFFTPEVRADISYIYDFAHPADNSIGGSSEVFRSGEFQITQFGVGGDFHWNNVRARLLTQLGMYSQTTPRNDASPARGQWQLADAYRYLSEAYGGYHFDVLDGINVDAGIFMSYIGLFSYYNFDNWAYQPSYVSSNTPWFFNGLRIQIFPNEHLKIEPWIINGWQSYGKFNNSQGFGAQILYRPNGKFEILGNQYFLGEDTLNTPGRRRYHTDDSIQYKYYDRPGNTLDRMAFSLTGDLGCESGGGVSCAGDTKGGPKQSFIGFMFYNRFWFLNDRYGVTVGGGAINNPGRYLVLLPPINGATAISGTPYFTENPGDRFKAWDTSATFDYMPSQYITFRFEYDHRAANVPYFTGHQGITPPGGNTGPPGSLVPGFTPDLRKTENRLNMALMVMF